jgi:hypothetical protein
MYQKPMKPKEDVMRTLLFITISLAFLLTSCTSPGSEALETCEKFLKYWGSGNNNAALTLSEGEQIKFDLKKHSIKRKMDDITFLNQSLEVKEESLNDDKTELTLQLHHEFTYNPPGVYSTSGVMKAVFLDSFTLKKTAEGWKVASFNPALEEIIELR